MKTLDQMMIFSLVVEHMSFTAAAKQLGVSKGHVSQQISQLEEALGATLLTRTTRLLKLTEEGLLVWDQCKKLNQVLGETRDGLAEMQGEVRGRLRIAAPRAFGEAFLVEVAESFLKKYPEIEVDLDLANRPLDLLRNDFDLAIRITNDPPESLIARPLTGVHYVFVATPEYIKKYGTPETPKDLSEYRCVSLISSKNRWTYIEDQELKHVEIHCYFRTNLNSTLKQAVMKGMGIARIPSYVIRHELEAGQLIRLFPEYHRETVPICVLYPPRTPRPLKVKYFLEHLYSWFQ